MRAVLLLTALGIWRAKLLALLRALSGSLKVRLTVAGSCALAIGICASVFVLLHKAETDTLRESQHQETSEAVRTAAQLASRMLDHQRALAVAAQRLTPAVLASEDLLARFLDENVVLRSKFGSVWVADPRGRVLMLGDPDGLKRPSVDLGDREYMQRALREGRPVVSEPVISRVSGEPTVLLVHPLVADGKVYGVLAAGLRLASRDLMEGVADSVQDDDSVLVAVTDSKGFLLAHPKRQLVGTSAAKDASLAGGYARWVAEGKIAEPDGLDLEAGDRIIGAAGVPGPDWLVWRSRSKRDVLAPLAAGRAEAVRWAAGIIVVLSGVLSALLGWLLLPLSRLERRAGHLFDGTLGAQAGWPAERGEVGRLQRVLRHVAAERAQLESFNAQVLSRLQSVMAAAPVGIAFTRAQRFELVSAEFCRLVGQSEGELLGQPAAWLLGAAAQDGSHEDAQQMVERELHGADGRRFWARLSSRWIDPHDSAGGTIWTVSDVTADVESRSALEWSASHDALTGLGNRRKFERRLQDMLAAPQQAVPAAILVFDLDRFKPINDSEGHAAGDAMLKTVANVASAAVRAGDLVVRLGGDEFAVVLERCPIDVALRIGESIRREIEDISLPWEGRLLSVGVSVGVAELPSHACAVHDWIAAADRACYEAKSAGRNLVRVARPLASGEPLPA